MPIKNRIADFQNEMVESDAIGKIDPGNSDSKNKPILSSSNGKFEEDANAAESDVVLINFLLSKFFIDDNLTINLRDFFIFNRINVYV